jgi:hypothetical protein
MKQDVSLLNLVQVGLLAPNAALVIEFLGTEHIASVLDDGQVSFMRGSFMFYFKMHFCKPKTQKNFCVPVAGFLVAVYSLQLYPQHFFIPAGTPQSLFTSLYTSKVS